MAVCLVQFTKSLEEKQSKKVCFSYKSLVVGCAYERSAYYLTQMEVSVVLKKEVIHDDYDVVLLKAFFAVNDMYLPLSPTAVLKLVADDKLQFQIRDRVEGFSEWKENELKKLSA